MSGAAAVRRKDRHQDLRPESPDYAHRVVAQQLPRDPRRSKRLVERACVAEVVGATRSTAARRRCLTRGDELSAYADQPQILRRALRPTRFCPPSPRRQRQVGGLAGHAPGDEASAGVVSSSSGCAPITRSRRCTSSLRQELGRAPPRPPVGGRFERRRVQRALAGDQVIESRRNVTARGSSEVIFKVRSYGSTE